MALVYVTVDFKLDRLFEVFFFIVKASGSWLDSSGFWCLGALLA